jgi:hypothetical protein
MQTNLSKRLARVGLWLVLVWLPMVFYLLMVGADSVALGPLRGDALAALLSFGWPALLGGISVVLLLALLQFFQRRLRQPSYWQRWWSAPVAVGLGAYLLGCLVQLVLPPALLHWYAFNPQQPGWKPMYWWPFFNNSSGIYGGWTLYPPLSAFEMRGYALIPPVEASCIKLGALLATLLFYWRSLARSKTKQLESAKLI